MVVRAPGILIALLGAGLSLINFSIDEIINPKLRLAPQHARSVRQAKKAGKGIEADVAENTEEVAACVPKPC